jgi:hypothetical protein
MVSSLPVSKHETGLPVRNAAIEELRAMPCQYPATHLHVAGTAPAEL